MPNPIYLLDFRHGKVVELASDREKSGQAALDEPDADASRPPEVTFAALGSPVKHED